MYTFCAHLNIQLIHILTEIWLLNYAQKFILEYFSTHFQHHSQLNSPSMRTLICSMYSVKIWSEHLVHRSHKKKSISGALPSLTGEWGRGGEERAHGGMGVRRQCQLCATRSSSTFHCHLLKAVHYCFAWAKIEKENKKSPTECVICSQSNRPGRWGVWGKGWVPPEPPTWAPGASTG